LRVINSRFLQTFVFKDSKHIVQALMVSQFGKYRGCSGLLVATRNGVKLGWRTNHHPPHTF